MSRTECIAYIVIAKRSKLFSELLTGLVGLGLFFHAETGILKQNNIAFLHCCNCSGSCFAGYIVIGYEYNFLAQLLGKCLCNRCKRFLLAGTFFYLAKMGAKDYLAAIIDQLLDSRKCTNDSVLVGNHTILQGNVEVTSYKDSSSLCVKIINRFLIQTHSAFLHLIII